MVCTWLQHINNSLAVWEDGHRSSLPTLDESSDVHSTTRTHIFQIYTLLATRYEVLLTWRTDPGWAAALHDAILGHTEAHFTNFASRDFHRVAARDPASRVARDRGRSLARARSGAWGLDFLNVRPFARLRARFSSFRLRRQRIVTSPPKAGKPSTTTSGAAVTGASTGAPQIAAAAGRATMAAPRKAPPPRATKAGARWTAGAFMVAGCRGNNVDREGSGRDW